MQASSLAVLQSARFGSVGISLVACGRGSVGGASLSRRIGSELGEQQLRLYVVRSGEFARMADEDDRVVGIGSGVFGFSDEQELRVGIGCEILVIDAPLELMHQAFGTGFCARTVPVDRDSQLLRPVVSFTAQILQDRRADYSNMSRYYIERLVQEMLLGLLLDAKRTAKAPISASPYLLAQAIIEARSSDADLTTDVIAEEVRLSRRQLERLFQKNGTTVAGKVRASRVAAAATMLRDPSYAALGVDEVARYVGYGAGSSLTRAMAAEGMPAPSALRRAMA